MATGVRGLGRGLDALLGGPGRDRAEAGSEVRMLSLDAIHPNRFQPRQNFSEQSLNELAASIKSKGVLQPVLVRPDGAGSYELVAGERRFRASRLAGLQDIPVLVRDLSDRESLAIALIENLQREDLNPIEEAKGYQQLLERFEFSQEELAAHLGKSRPALTNAVRLLGLPEAMQRDIQEGRLSAGHGRALVSVTDDQARAGLYQRLLDHGLSVRQAEAEAAHWKKHGALPEAPALSGAGGRAVVRAKSGPVKADPRLLGLQEGLSRAFEVRVRVSGLPDKGKVTFHFDTESDLMRLAGLFGVTIDH
ncbi:MAG: ParB/RepB/Spo0J family partition protein [Desulfovibrionaceae bacterium]|nr:ParB/RepB/Spo0J family partition protein [Desulfovibrionaceae bacterium]